jgi:hypothetical protein
MKLKDFELNNDNHFIAMQYFGLILNKIYLVLLTKDRIIAIKVNGLVSIESSGNILAKELSNTMTVKGDLQNPYSYINPKYFAKMQDLELDDVNILAQNKSNFVIHRINVTNAYYDLKKKWGMGYYPHDGKVYVSTNDGKKKEFIILGNQSGHKVASLILTKKTEL